jgi:hypothetical protein
VPSFTVTGDPGDDEPRLTEEQRAALVRAFSTPAMTESLERIGRTIRPFVAKINTQCNEVLVAQLEPVLRASAIQMSNIGESLRPLIEQQLHTRRIMEPLFAQIAERQQEWAKALIGPLSASADLQARMAGMLVTPELTAALERINKLSRVRLEMPDADGLDRLSKLIDAGEIDEETLATAEAGLVSEAALAAAIDDAADVLARERPWMSRERWRKVVVVWVWLMWTAGLVAISMAAPPIVGEVASAAGLLASKEAAEKTGKVFDRRFPPEPEPEQPVP